MAKYQYKNYITRAFWNSLLAVLSALVIVLIIIFSWQSIQNVLNRIVTNDDGTSGDVTNEEDNLEILESLRAENTMSEEESAEILEGLSDEEGEAEENMELLESLRQN